MAGKGDPKKVVIAALIGNAGIAVAKFVAAGLSGSVTMLAEGVHSVADTANQALLLLGMSLAKKRSSPLYPLGRYRESYFWAFIVSLVLFFLGGVFAVYEGTHKLLHAEEAPSSPLVPLIVLGVSIALEASSFTVAMREFNKQRGERRIWDALFSGKDPTIPLVLLEDAGAVFGLLIALVAILLTWITGNPIFDGAGSIVIGVLLCVIGVLLAKDTRSLLLGESASPELEALAIKSATGVDGVEAVTQLLSMHLGPDAVLLAMKVKLRAHMALEEVERTIDAVEAAIEAAAPEAKRIFIEPDSDYDVRLDPERAGALRS